MTFKDLIKESGMTKEFIYQKAPIARTRLYLAIAGRYTLNSNEIKRVAKVLRVTQAKVREANA